MAGRDARESRAVLILAPETVMRHQRTTWQSSISSGGRCLMMRILSFALLPAVAALAASPPRACLRSALSPARCGRPPCMFEPVRHKRPVEADPPLDGSPEGLLRKKEWRGRQLADSVVSVAGRSARVEKRPRAQEGKGVKEGGSPLFVCPFFRVLGSSDRSPGLFWSVGGWVGRSVGG